MFSSGTITFKGNPWPDGHGIKTFVWSGRLFSDRVTFDFDLRSVDYDDDDDAEEEEEEEDDDRGDWGAKIVWTNYHACTLSSGDSEGFVVGTEKRPVDLDALDGQSFRVDRLPLAGKPCFATYLLGHDSVADHKVK